MTSIKQEEVEEISDFQYINFYHIKHKVPTPSILYCIKNNLNEITLTKHIALFVLRWPSIVITASFIIVITIVQISNRGVRIRRPQEVQLVQETNTAAQETALQTINFNECFEAIINMLELHKQKISVVEHSNPTILEKMNHIEKKLKAFSSRYECPISQSIMNKPVTLSSGITYDEISIKNHLLISEQIINPITHIKPAPMCPISHEKLAPTENSTSQFNVNFIIKNQIKKSLNKLEKSLEILVHSIEEAKQNMENNHTNYINANFSPS